MNEAVGGGDTKEGEPLVPRLFCGILSPISAAVGRNRTPRGVSA